MPLETKTHTLVSGYNDISPFITRLQAQENNGFNSFKPFPTDYELVHLATVAYKTPAEQQSFLTSHPYLSGWMVVTTAENKEDSYNGSAFYHSAKAMLVIAHRGTDILSEFLTANNEGIMHSRVTSQMASAEEFTQYVLKIMHGKYLQLSFTGHSLGGWLAQVTAFHAEQRNQHAHVVVLDSPGGASMLTDLQPSQQGQIALANLDVINYVAAPDMVNVCNQHIGKMYRLFPDLPEWKGFRNLLEYFQYTYSNHCSDGLVKLFDPVTGKPREYKEVHSWPSVQLEQQNTSSYRAIAFCRLAWEFVTHRDDDQYAEFFRWATRTNNYDPTPTDFPGQYRLINRAKYHVGDVKIAECLASVFDRNTVSFLQLYATLRFIFDNGIPHGFEAFAARERAGNLPRVLADYELREEVQDGEKRLILSCRGSLTDFIRYIRAMLLANPEFIKNFNEYVGHVLPAMQEQLVNLGRGQKKAGRDIRGLKRDLDTLKEQLAAVHSNQVAAQTEGVPEEITIDVRLTTPFLSTPGAALPEIPASWARFLHQPPAAAAAAAAASPSTAKKTIKINRDIQVGVLAILDIFSKGLEQALPVQAEDEKKTLVQTQDLR